METETLTFDDIARTLDEYQTLADETAVYPDQYKIAYPALGVVEEAREFLNAVFDQQGRDEVAVLKEAGDVFWYCSALALDLGYTLSECFEIQSPKVRQPGEFLGLVSELAGHSKKILRGDDNRAAKGERVAAIISQVLEYVVEFIPGHQCDAYNLVCDTNIAKLFDRKERGVLKGSGDNR